MSGRFDVAGAVAPEPLDGALQGDYLGFELRDALQELAFARRARGVSRVERKPDLMQSMPPRSLSK